MIAGMGIDVHVRYFAAAADAAGCDEETITAKPGATIAEIRAELGQRHGEKLTEVLQLCSFLLDGQAAEPHDQLPDKTAAGIDVLPPFAGG